MSMCGCRVIVWGDSCATVTYSLTCKGKCELITQNVDIDNLATVKFKWSAEDVDNKLKIEIFFSTSKHMLSLDRTIKINVASVNLNYSKQNIESPENWSDWQLMGCLERKTGIVISFSCYVRAFEVKLDKLGLMLHTDTDFTDFHLATTEGAVAVHKSCLAAHSEVFRNMLTGEWKETAEGKINIKGVSLQTLQHLKDYIYLDTVPEEGLRPLLLLARCYLMEDLKKHCIKKLAETVVAEDLYSLIQFACENNIPELAYAMLQITGDSVISKAHEINKQPDKEVEEGEDE